MIKQVGTALVAVFIIVFFITFDLRVTLFILLSVALVEYFMAAMIYFWGISLNNIVAMNMIFALGISIDYAVHIAHKYLVTDPLIDDGVNGVMTN